MAKSDCYFTSIPFGGSPVHRSFLGLTVVLVSATAFGIACDSSDPPDSQNPTQESKPTDPKDKTPATHYEGPSNANKTDSGRSSSGTSGSHGTSSGTSGYGSSGHSSSGYGSSGDDYGDEGSSGADGPSDTPDGG